MSIIHCKDIQLLIDLQEKDGILDDSRSQLEAVPGQIQSMLDGLEEKKGLVSAGKEALTTLQVTKKDKEIELTGKEELLKKHHTTLNQIKSNDAFKALLTEIETIKKDKDDIETGILQAMDEIDQALKKQRQISLELKDLEEKTRKDIAGLEEKKSRLETELSSLESDRAAFSSNIDPDTFSRYEYIRTQKKGLAVTSVKKRTSKEGGGASCGGCNIALTPQCLVDLKKKDVIIICDNCQRIIFSREPAENKSDAVNAQSGDAKP